MPLINQQLQKRETKFTLKLILAGTMILNQRPGIPVAAQILSFTILAFTWLTIIPGSLQADTIAEEAQKITAASNAASLFAQLAGEQKAAGDFWLCFRSAAAAGAAAEAAADLTRQISDRIEALSADQRSQYETYRSQAGIVSKSARKAAESVQSYVMQGLGLITILLLIFLAMLIWLIRGGAVGPFIKRPEEQA